MKSLPIRLACLLGLSLAVAHAASDVSVTSGGNSTLSNRGLLPAITKASGRSDLVFTYKRKIAATVVTQVIEHATSLSPPWTPAVHGAGGVTIITAAVPGDATAEQVTVTIPSTSSSRFVRLKASR